ncbi:MAG: hypothetical protein IK066_04115 [Kiritimatiellae bacterium]|nr:hypothetical protein [Kiritimatiellia bacterium]
MKTTVVTAGDAEYAWGVLLLVASMRRNGMDHPVVVGAMDWPDRMKRRVLALGNVKIRELPKSRQCVACQKPMLMGCEEVETDWVCWADADGAFVGDCSEWLVGENPDEIVVRKYNPPPPLLTAERLEAWRRDVERLCGKALPESRLGGTTVNNPFIVIHRKWRPFLERWRRQTETVIAPDVATPWQKNSVYFQTDESVLGSLLCFDPDAPAVAADYKANGSADPKRYYAHFSYNPKPWRMWTARAVYWRDEIWSVAEWLVERGVVDKLPLPLRRNWWPLWRMLVPAAPWVWRATKLKRKLFPR